MATIAELTTERDVLAARLDVGWRKIEAAQARGKDVTGLEDFWEELLKTYELCCDQLAGVSTSPGRAQVGELRQGRMPISVGVR